MTHRYREQASGYQWGGSGRYKLYKIGLRMCCTALGKQPIFCNNCNWKVTFKNCRKLKKFLETSLKHLRVSGQVTFQPMRGGRTFREQRWREKQCEPKKSFTQHNCVLHRKRKTPFLKTAVMGLYDFSFFFFF